MRRWLLPEHIEDILPADARTVERLRRATLDLFVIHADGTGLRRLTGRSSVSAHRWSPDVSLIAYTNRGSLWLIHPDEMGRVRLVSRSKLSVLAMTWSPDGARGLMRRWLLPEHIEDILPDEARTVERLRRAILDLFATHGYDLVQPNKTPM